MYQKLNVHAPKTIRPELANEQDKARVSLANAAKDGHLNPDSTFKGGFDGCVAYMQTEAGGDHSAEGAKKICGSIAASKG